MSSKYLAQFKELILREPKMGLPMVHCENCDYNSFLYKSKNCYLCFASSNIEDCFHADTCISAKDSCDITFCGDCELCYECLDCQKCYGCKFGQDLNNCTDCWFCFDCLSCQDCFGCVGLRRKNYHLFNEKLSQEDYQKKVTHYKKNVNDPEVRKDIEKKFQDLQLKTPRLYMRGHKNEQVFGDYIENSKNCYMAFNATENEDCTYLYDEVYKNRDCVDLTHSHNSELCYEIGSCDLSYNCNWMFISVSNRDCEFCIFCEQSDHCFMCVNLKHKKFHILNKAYSKEDYYKKIAEIKEELKEAGIHGENLLYLAMKD